MNYIIKNEDKLYPSKIVCIGRNYVKHIEELNNEIPSEMVFFIKPNSSICDKVVFPKNQNSCHYEAEISFLIEDNKIVAVSFGLDLTLREIQSKLKAKGLPWERAKAFNNSAVFSKFVTFDGKLEDLSIELYINNKLRQKGNLTQMINKPIDMIKEVNSFLKLENGDILMSGTPSGVGEFEIGDLFLGKIMYNNKLMVEFESVVT